MSKIAYIVGFGMMINAFATGFIVRNELDSTSTKQSFVVSSASAIKNLHPNEKENIASLAKDIWHRDDVATFRCKYAGDKPSCTSLLDGTPMEVSLAPETSKKLLESTKPLWSTEGYKELSHIDCALGEGARCQIFGSIERKYAELAPGQCISAIIKGT